MTRTLGAFMVVLAVPALRGGRPRGDGLRRRRDDRRGDPDHDPAVQAEGFVGQKVRVEGVITGVCEKRGCWMQLTDPDSARAFASRSRTGDCHPYESMGTALRPRVSSRPSS